MIERHALVDITGNVVDIIFIDPSGEHGDWPVPKGYQLIDTAGAPVNPYDTWDGKTFTCTSTVAACVPPVPDTSVPAPINAILAAAAVVATPIPEKPLTD